MGFTNLTNVQLEIYDTIKRRAKPHGEKAPGKSSEPYPELPFGEGHAISFDELPPDVRALIVDHLAMKPQTDDIIRELVRAEISACQNAAAYGAQLSGPAANEHLAKLWLKNNMTASQAVNSQRGLVS